MLYDVNFNHLSLNLILSVVDFNIPILNLIKENWYDNKLNEYYTDFSDITLSINTIEYHELYRGLQV